MTASSPAAKHPVAFPYLLLPSFLAARNRARRGQKGDGMRGGLFGGVGLVVGAAIFGIVFWLTRSLLDYAELGDYLIRLALSWLFLTFLSFLAFSGVVTSLSTFFLSEDLRLLLAAPISTARLFHARLARTVVQASWMVVVFLVPILLALGLARCAGWRFYASALAAVLPFVVIPVTAGALVTLVLVNIFPARRARDILMLMGLLFAGVLVLMLRFLQPEQLLKVESLPDITGFFATLQSPVTPLLPSFWAGETIFSGLLGGFDAVHAGALWTTAFATVVVVRLAYDRFYFAGWSKAQEARKARFTRLVLLERLVHRLPVAPATRQLVLKDLKVFLRDTTQWSQLLLLLALALVYLYNFRVLDLDRIPYMSGIVKNAYAFVNLGLAGFVLSAVAVRFVFPAVSAEGAAFWVIRTSPVPLRTFLLSKFAIGLVPVLVLAEGLTVAANEFLGAEPVLKVLCALAVPFLSVALVALATGMGARYPRFNAENLTQVAGSYGGIAFMILAVLFLLVEVGLLAWPSFLYLWHRFEGVPLSTRQWLAMATSLAAAAAIAIAVTWRSLRAGIRALDDLRA
jgi:ABC-2 type transport system permease protein